MSSKKKKSKCWKCDYHSKVDIGEVLPACMYIVYEKRRRPCPGGEECTVFKPKKRRRKPV